MALFSPLRFAVQVLQAMRARLRRPPMTSRRRPIPPWENRSIRRAM